MIASLEPGLSRAVSPHAGIVGSLEECLHGTADPPLFQATCALPAGEGLLGAPLGHLFSVGGTGATRAEAAGAAVGEALERYSATYVPRARLVFATARELGDVAVAPERFALFSERQHRTPGFPFRRFTADTRVAWVERPIASRRGAGAAAGGARLSRAGSTPGRGSDRLRHQQRPRVRREPRERDREGGARGARA